MPVNDWYHCHCWCGVDVQCPRGLSSLWCWVKNWRNRFHCVHAEEGGLGMDGHCQELVRKGSLVPETACNVRRIPSAATISATVRTWRYSQQVLMRESWRGFRFRDRARSMRKMPCSCWACGRDMPSISRRSWAWDRNFQMEAIHGCSTHFENCE